MVIVREERPEDVIHIRHVNDEAFGREQESELVEKLRDHGMLPISLVAILDNEVVGHIAFSPVTIESAPSSLKAMTLAPVAVLPEYQRNGIGSQLVHAGLKECRRREQDLVFLVGHPDYYPRFGFVLARPRGIDCEFEVPEAAWMVVELRQGALSGLKGMVKFQPEFQEAVR